MKSTSVFTIAILTDYCQKISAAQKGAERSSSRNDSFFSENTSFWRALLSSLRNLRAPLPLEQPGERFDAADRRARSACAGRLSPCRRSRAAAVVKP